MQFNCLANCTIGALICSLTLFFACKSDPKMDAAQLLGQWKGSAWMVFDKPADRDASAVNFTFEAGDKYTATYSEQQEKGVYRLEGNKLYTTAENKIEKMVKILRLNSDSLVFEMNRTGQEEKLILLKK